MKVLSFDPAIVNIGYASMCINNNKISKLNFGTFSLTNDKKVKDITFDQLMINLVEYLNIISIEDVDLVIIENTPSIKNPKVKSVSMALYVYYMIKGLKCKFVSPNSKPKEIKECKTYNERKKKSVELCYEIIDDMDKIKLQNYSRKHDISDCILQAKFYYDKLCSNIKK